MSPVTVSLDLTEVGYVFNVKVASRVKSHLKAKVSVDPAECANADHVLKRVIQAAEHGAMHLEKTHGDSFNLTELRTFAHEAFSDCVLKSTSNVQGNEKRIAIMIADSSKLHNAQQEVVNRMKFLQTRQLPVPTRLQALFDQTWDAYNRS